MTQQKTSFREEFAIIPQYMYLFIVAGFAGILFLFLDVIPAHDPHSPPLPARLLLSVLMGIVVAIYFLLIGYVSQDTKRRDMNQFGWTLLVICFFNGLGPLVYFLLRKPLIQYCPQCGERVEKGFHYCAKCGCELAPSCGSCGQAVSREYVVCPYCGKTLGAGASAPATP